MIFYGGGRSGSAVEAIGDVTRRIEESEGEFVTILMDKAAGQVHIINDRFAIRAFYILQERDRFVFASNLAFLLHLAGGKAAIDPLGWLQIFSYSHALDRQTISRMSSRSGRQVI